MIAGHTKFAPDRLFAILANKYYSSDVFNEQQFVAIYQQHADVTFDGGKLYDAGVKLSPRSTQIFQGSDPFTILLQLKTQAQKQL